MSVPTHGNANRNTLLDFSFYKAHAQMEAMEAAGMQSYLRDMNGVVTSVCNDGDV